MNSKPMTIPKLLVWRAWHVVKAANGGPGVDQVTLEMYENDLNSNLYMLWNRMSSGTYFPSAVKQVAIPKAKGVRYLGIPTVNDRTA
jgi:retron-type reverse transcriptase